MATEQKLPGLPDHSTSNSRLSLISCYFKSLFNSSQFSPVNESKTCKQPIHLQLPGAQQGWDKKAALPSSILEPLLQRRRRRQRCERHIAAARDEPQRPAGSASAPVTCGSLRSSCSRGKGAAPLPWHRAEMGTTGLSAVAGHHTAGPIFALLAALHIVSRALPLARFPCALCLVES